jgi:prolyl 4-hydroxylase
MSTVVHFTQDLSAWIVGHLDRACPPATIIDIMVAERMEWRVAQAIVAAFVDARRRGDPLPVDAITLDDAALDYVYETPIFHHGSRIVTADRTVRVAARAARPMLAVLADLLSAEECEALIALARPRLAPSTVVDPDSGHDVVAPHRNSLGMFFRLRENPFIARLDQRLAEVMNLPIENGEGIQVLHYPAGALNTPHFDFLLPSNPENRASIARSGQRMSTLIAYLNDVENGGETAFPAAGWEVSPQRGSAVYFEYCNSRGQVDHRSLHGGNPVLAGEKWVATKWMRQRCFVSASEAGSEGMMRQDIHVRDV